MAVLHQHHGKTVGDGTLGMAARWASRDHQLFRSRRSGGDDAALFWLRTGESTVGKVQGSRNSAEGAKRRLGVAGRFAGYGAPEGGFEFFQDGQQQPDRGV